MHRSYKRYLGYKHPRPEKRTRYVPPALPPKKAPRRAPAKKIEHITDFPIPPSERWGQKECSKGICLESAVATATGVFPPSRNKLESVGVHYTNIPLSHKWSLYPYIQTRYIPGQEYSHAVVKMGPKKYYEANRPRSDYRRTKADITKEYGPVVGKLYPRIPEMHATGTQENPAEFNRQVAASLAAQRHKRSSAAAWVRSIPADAPPQKPPRLRTRNPP